VQHHITPQIARAQGFSLGADRGAAFTTKAPYPEDKGNGTPTQETLDLMKNQTDEVGCCNKSDQIQICFKLITTCTSSCASTESAAGIANG
jgi:hypothetical protein